MIRVTRTAALLGCVAIGVAACSGASGGSGGSGAGTRGPAPTTSRSGIPGPSPASSPTVPQGWAPARQGALTFALPAGFTKRPPGTGMPGAATQWTKADSTGLAIPPAVAVFVETGRLGPLGVRAELLRDSRKATLGVDPIGPARQVQVPGAAGAAVLEWVWDYDFLADKPPVPSRQVEVLVQTSGSEQYGLLLGGPSKYLTDDVVTGFLASVALQPAEGPE
jgi:hypothetical protein